LGKAIVADRETAAVNLAGLHVDFAAMRDGAARLDDAPTETLERLCSSTSGDFMEDLDLPNCDEFNAWRIAMAEDVRTRLDRICAELVSRELPPDQLLLPSAPGLSGARMIPSRTRCWSGSCLPPIARMKRNSSGH
jgi:hypothetical protein